MTVRSFSPQAPGELVGEFATSDASDVEAAVGRARVAQGEWWAGGPAARAAALDAAATALEARRDEAVALTVREVGKPITEAQGELVRAVAILRYYAQACFAAAGEQLPAPGRSLLLTRRRPLGVAGLITPWNFPFAIPLWKAAPALAAGNAVVLKPSPEASATASWLADILGSVLPEGCVSVVHGNAATGAAVVGHADAVSFTGSASAGRSVAAAAVDRGIPVQCEMGGQNAAIVLPDADPASTAALIAGAAMAYAGQKCTATRRIIVVGPDHGFLEALVSAVAALTPAAPELATTTVGPVINGQAEKHLQEAGETARSDGGRLLVEAEVADGDGWYVAPTLIEGLPAHHVLAVEETFGPFALVLHVADLGEAIAVTNSVRYGLVTSVHGRDIDSILDAVDQLDTGMIKVNAPTTGVDFYAPFGGEKDSSYGRREQGSAALDFYSSTRTITVAQQRA